LTRLAKLPFLHESEEQAIASPSPFGTKGFQRTFDIAGSGCVQAFWM
jgi:hypothetical protein